MSDPGMAACNLEWLDHVLRIRHRVDGTFAITRSFVLSRIERLMSFAVTQPMPRFVQFPPPVAFPAFEVSGAT